MPRHRAPSASSRVLTTVTLTGAALGLSVVAATAPALASPATHGSQVSPAAWTAPQAASSDNDSRKNDSHKNDSRKGEGHTSTNTRSRSGHRKPEKWSSSKTSHPKTSSHPQTSSSTGHRRTSN